MMLRFRLSERTSTSQNLVRIAQGITLPVGFALLGGDAFWLARYLLAILIHCLGVREIWLFYRQTQMSTRS